MSYNNLWSLSIKGISCFNDGENILNFHKSIGESSAYCIVFVMSIYIYNK